MWTHFFIYHVILFFLSSTEDLTWEPFRQYSLDPPIYKSGNTNSSGFYSTSEKCSTVFFTYLSQLSSLDHLKNDRHRY